MSTKSCGVWARYRVNTTADNAGRSWARVDQLIGHRLQFAEIDVAALLGLQLEAAGVAQAVDRRRPEDADHGALDLLVAPLLDLARRSPRRTRRVPSAGRTASRTTNIEPRFEPLVVVRNDIAGDADRVGDAGDALVGPATRDRRRAIRSIFS